ncbi:hypothetical protein B7486_66400, partial [cyanobacterium TDX16]
MDFGVWQGAPLHADGRRWGRARAAMVGALAVGALVAAACGSTDEGARTDDSVAAPTSTAAPVSTTTTAPPFDGWVDPASSGQPYGDEVQGL